MTLDQYKTEEPQQDKTYECTECGTPVSEEGTICNSRACFKNSLL